MPRILEQVNGVATQDAYPLPAAPQYDCQDHTADMHTTRSLLFEPEASPLAHRHAILVLRFGTSGLQSRSTSR